MPIKNRLVNALEIFLWKLTKEDIKEVAWNIMTQYQNNKWKSHNNLLLRMIIIYSKQQLTTQFRKFIQWSKLSINKQKRNSIKSGKCYYSFEESIQNNNNNSSNANANNNIKNSSISNLSGLSINHKPISKAMTGFLNRQVRFQEIQTKSIEKVLKDSEEENALLCTFNPRINSNSREKLNKANELNQRHACLRLYDERIPRQNKKEQIEKNAIDQIKRDTSYNRTKVDEKKIIHLYEDFKIRKRNKRLLAKKVDSERGYTYTPDISSLNKPMTKISSFTSVNAMHGTQRSMTPIMYRTENNLGVKKHNSSYTKLNK